MAHCNPYDDMNQLREKWTNFTTTMNKKFNISDKKLSAEGQWKAYCNCSYTRSITNQAPECEYLFKANFIDKESVPSIVCKSNASQRCREFSVGMAKFSLDAPNAESCKDKDPIYRERSQLAEELLKSCE